MAGLAVALLAATSSAQAPRILYVNHAASGNDDGTSWADAYVHLQDALADAAANCDTTSTCEVWVAQGTYHPDEGAGITPGDKSATFHLIDGVGLYGGFAGTEETREQRDWVSYPTILSGDLNDDDLLPGRADCVDPYHDGTECNRDDNSDSVVTGWNTDRISATLDGFTVTAGYARSFSFDLDKGGESGGGGIRLVAGRGGNSSGAHIRNCRITGNVSAVGGGGVYVWGYGRQYNAPTEGPMLVHCTIAGNYAGRAAGIGVRHSSRVDIVNCSVVGNVAAGDGGGACFEHTGLVQVVDTVVAHNKLTRGGSSGAGLYQARGGTLKLKGSTVVHNDGPIGTVGGGVAMQFNGFDAMEIDNTIIWDNTAGAGRQLHTAYGTNVINVRSSNVARFNPDGKDIEGAGYVAFLGRVNLGTSAAHQPEFADLNGPDGDSDTWQDNDYRIVLRSEGSDAVADWMPAEDEIAECLAEIGLNMPETMVRSDRLAAMLRQWCMERITAAEGRTSADALCAQDENVGGQ